MWITLTADDLNDYLVAKQVAAYRTAALKEGQADPFGALMPDVVARIRNAILSCERNQVDADPLKIPQSLKWAACYLILEPMANRLNFSLTEDQRGSLNRAYTALRDVASCDLAIEVTPNPSTPSPVASGSRVEIVSSSPRIRTREALNGL